MGFKNFVENLKGKLNNLKDKKSSEKWSDDIFWSKKEEKIQPKEEKKEIKKEEKIDEKSKKFNELFWWKSEDIFDPLLKKEKVLNISWKNEAWNSLKTGKVSITEISKNEKTEKLLWKINSFVLILFSISITLSIWFTVFYYTITDEENIIFSNYWQATIGSSFKESKDFLISKNKEEWEIKNNIEKLTGWVIEKIYFNTTQFKGLPPKIKEDLLYFYNKDTWKLNELDKKTLLRLERFYKNNSELYALKAVFNKEYVLNDINENKIYWKDVYKELRNATNATFKYNEILNYITYNTFSINEQSEMNISWVVMDPSWKVFEQLIKLTKTINRNSHFEWAKILHFNKTINEDENVWWMLSPINLRLSYKK